MTIRIEKEQDRTAIAILIARTYGAYGADVIAQTGLLREWEKVAKPTGYVMEQDGDAVAYALYTPIGEVDDAHVVLLAPLAFDLLREGVDFENFLPQTYDKLKEKGVGFVAMMGDYSQNKAQGFERASDVGFSITQKFQGAEMLVKPLNGGKGSGTLSVPEFLL